MYRQNKLIRLWELKTKAKSILAFYHLQGRFDDYLEKVKAIEAKPKCEAQS